MALGLRFDILARNRASGPLDDVSDSARRTGGALSGIGRAAAIGLGGAALGAIAGFGAALKGGFEEAVSYQKITDQLAQTLKSTGGAAGVSIEGLKAYAGQLESLSGVDEELILSSQNVLATFTKIQNKTGAGNDVFNQASLAALNLSTTLGTDVNGAAVQVGKALNDPIKGITALGKAGVSFTEQQKEQIKTLVKSGKTLDAQKIILGELNTEFGGAAAAAGQGLGGSLARLKDSVSDTFRTIATKALPTLTTMSEFLAEKLPGAIEKVSSVLATMTKFVKDNATAFKIGAGIVAGLTAGFVLYSTTVRIVTGVTAAFQTVSALLNGTLALNPIGLVVVGLAALAAGLIVAYKKSETFRNIVDAVAAVFREKVLPVLQTYINVQIIVTKKVLEVIAAFTRFGVKVAETALAVGRFVADVVRFVTTVQGKVVEALAGLGGAILRTVRAAFGNLKTGASEKTTELVAFLLGVPFQIIGAIGDLGNLLYQKGKDLIGGLLNGIKDAATSIPGAIKDAVTFDVPGINLRGAGGGGSAPPPPTSVPSASFGSSRPTGTFSAAADMRETNALLRILIGHSVEQVAATTGVPQTAHTKFRTRVAGVTG